MVPDRVQVEKVVITPKGAGFQPKPQAERGGETLAPGDFGNI